MNRDLVLVYGEWRTGTNLLLSMFRKRGYLDLNEFYSCISDVDVINEKLLDILCQKVLTKCTVKVMFPQIDHVEPNITDMFTKKILVYRRDIFSTIISRIVAETRKSWYRSTYIPEQPEFNKKIAKQEFVAVANSVISDYVTFINEGYSKINIDHVVNYEDDLVPYTKQNPTDSLPTGNYTIDNLEELRKFFEETYSKKVLMINQFFDTVRQETNKQELDKIFN